MKPVFAAVLFCFFSIMCQAQSDAIRIDSVKAQLIRKQHLSALETLGNVTDPKLSIPLLVGLLTEHHSGYYTGYTKWKLSDAAAGTSKRRESDVEIDLEALITGFIQSNPKDCAAYELLARFYSWIFAEKGQDLPVPDARSMYEYLVKLTPTGCGSSYQSFVYGSALELLEASPAALTQLKKAIQLNERFAPAYLQLAYANLARGQFADARANATRASQLFTADRQKARAWLALGMAYEGSNENERALASYLTADSLSRKDFFIQKAIMGYYVKTGNAAASQATTSFVGAQGRTSMHCYADVIEVYEKYNRQSDLVMWCQKMLDQYQSNTEAVACLNFTLGRAFIVVNKQTAKEYFRKAREMGVNAEKYPPTRNHPKTKKMIEEGFAMK